MNTEKIIIKITVPINNNDTVESVCEFDIDDIRKGVIYPFNLKENKFNDFNEQSETPRFGCIDIKINKD